MKIKTMLQISAIFSMVMTIAIGLILFSTSQRVNRAIQKNILANKIVESVSELDVITYDYLLHREERPQAQWRLRHNSLTKLLTGGEFKGLKEQLILGRILQSHESIGVLFFQLITNYEKQRILGKGKIAASLELEERLIARILVKSRMMVADAFQLSDVNNAEILTAKQTADLFVMLFIIILAAIVMVNSFLFGRRIVKSISKLQEGTEIIAGGNLDYSIDIRSNDEIGNLTRAFNQMTRKLKESYTELEKRVEERTADLAKTNETLQNQIIERKRAEDEVRRLNEDLEVFNQEIETLVSERIMSMMALTVADKIRNPAAVIGWTCKRILEKEKIPERLCENLKDVIDESERLESMVRDFETLLKSKQSMFKHEDINEIVKGIVSIVEKEADEKGVELSVNLLECPLKINTQKNLLKPAIFHVIRNAIEATPKGGRVTVSTLRKNEKVILTISDTGSGIPEACIDKIFDPFFSTKEHRFGMGLPLVKQVVLEHMGEIKVESEAGKGTTFNIIFPIRWLEKKTG